MKKLRLIALMLIAFVSTTLVQKTFAQKAPLITIANGVLQGINYLGTNIFKGIPFAQPPVGSLRWQEPQPVKNWNGVLKADHFRSNAMQKPVFGDMRFRADSMSEDCLYLNVWAPAKKAKTKMPVLVYFYGGGYVAGDGSERRYDGESMSQKGIVAVTVNYRLGVFGFLAHPELTKESPHHASGNYGLLDQSAALRWVQQNIAAFGGDPKRVTIAGESAGSISVCAQMASPLSKNLIAGAIGESGGMINPTLAPIPLADGERNGENFARRAGAASLAQLRAMPAAQILDSASKPGAFRTVATIDGYFLPKTPFAIFAAGEQAHVPLLAGWNSAEVPYQAFMGGDAPTPENYAKKVSMQYGDRGDEVLKLYPDATQDEVIASATALASDRFIVYSTWKWADLQAKTGGKAVYTYQFSRVRPAMVAALGNAKPGLAGGIIKGGSTGADDKVPKPFAGASHASEIEYAMGNLATNPDFAWTADDYKVSTTMEAYFANFVKTGNPNGAGLPLWPANTPAEMQLMNINVDTHLQADTTKQRYLFLDKEYVK